MIGNADSWGAIERFGRAKLPWLRTYLDLPHGMPSHDTCGRVFAALEADARECCFIGWGRALVGEAAPGTIAIDGKTVRRSHDHTAGQGPLHLVSSWASDAGLILSQVATRDKSNEITALPALLETLRLQGALITIDARGCQCTIAPQIVEAGGDDVLALKENQPALHEVVVDHCSLDDTGSKRQLRTVATDHGRLESRTCQVTDEPAVLAWRDPDRSWLGLRSITAVTGTRRIGETETTETR